MTGTIFTKNKRFWFIWLLGFVVKRRSAGFKHQTRNHAELLGRNHAGLLGCNHARLRGRNHAGLLGELGNLQSVRNAKTIVVLSFNIDLRLSLAMWIGMDRQRTLSIPPTCFLPHIPVCGYQYFGVSSVG